ncbi:uncharacterized protein LOC113303957 [Papaver somniferum]|uniref:uncharacterized protein LOC113303957 n=1 Tax=Papaver somniferum TaxID=3469 RepID=UPI000E6F8A50|nr:uncharacterized protein LOC113303957 [Papaver somniferum]XP_026408829.1 uncharacterized protein LOC113303957 [Papaver somniferum]XP_026408830.1 uncharacterized protein LOC113303957 [Papaver somniferum]XP_026408831.1 uncharacterized protein LOC113303957 [Papaver somniferum]XP_026408832.1 uncharacterized protein LOC113303957 [Papaver somniferum]XP_026408833.1 uncharacterized protein LOC113303957 [Papaver somniferum]XP_026408834.1 uncharacterized protein LOC113303957 [Papaver somniferum]
MKERKDCGDANTSTVTEKNKRPYKRKDCGDTNTSTVMKKKKRAYTRKDCIGINTPTVMEKKKRPYRRKKHLPRDLVMKEILTKLPVPTLLTSVLVSKLWYNSIHNDHKRLTYSHFLQSQKQPNVILSLLNVRDCDVVVKKTGEPRYGSYFFKFAAGMYDRENENALQFDKFRGGNVGRGICEMVGYCRGLPCIAAADEHSTDYIILDPNRKDFLHIFSDFFGAGACIICHGFGFDHSTNVYKLVSIFRTIEKELNIMVFTLGTKSWRNVTATTTPISGRPITKIRAPTGSDKSAIFCNTSSSRGSGCLVWKIITTPGGAGSDNIQHDNSNAVNDSEMEMLLPFTLHDEKFQFIQLPAKSTTDEQQKHLHVDYPHLLEFKGSPCIARVEKISGNGSDYPHRCCDDHQGSSSRSCCCCCKVHLYILKDKVKQVWVKEESFDVRVTSSPEWSRKQAPDPCCFCFGSTTTAPPTRIFSFSDQILLYWFKGKSLQIYNLRSEKLQHVVPYNYREHVLFGDKMKEPRHIFISGDDDIYCSNMDYQLHCHEENFLSLQTFILEGVEGVDADDFYKLDLEKSSAYIFIYRGSKVCYPLFS